MKKINKYILIGIILVCVLIIGVYWVKNFTSIPANPTFPSSPTSHATIAQKTQSSPTLQATVYPTRKPDPTGQVLDNGWLRFNYPEAGYYVDYPPDAVFDLSVIASMEYSQAVFYLPGSVDDYGLALRIITYINTEDMTLDQFVDEKLGKVINKIPTDVIGNKQKTKTNIAGHSAISSETYINCPIVFIESGEKVYVILLAPNMTTGNMPTEKSVDLFWQMVNTFTIL